MNNFFVYESNGKIINCGTYTDSAPPAQENTVVAVGSATLGHYYCAETDSVKIIPPQPSPNHTFDYTTKQWIDPRTLQDFKDAQWSQIKQARTQAEYGGFEWGGSRFDSDATSQNRITGAVQLAQIAPGFTIDWTLENNAVRTMSAADMVAVGAALGVHVQTQFARAQALRVQIDAAATKEEVEAVVW